MINNADMIRLKNVIHSICRQLKNVAYYTLIQENFE